MAVLEGTFPRLPNDKGGTTLLRAMPAKVALVCGMGEVSELFRPFSHGTARYREVSSV